MKLYVKARWIFLLVFISQKVTSRDQIDDLFTRRAKSYDPANNPSLDLDTYKPCYGNTKHCGQCETGFVPCLFYDAYKMWGTADYIGCIKYGERDKCCSKGGGWDGTWFYIEFFVPNGMTCRHLSSELRPGGGGSQCDKRNYGYCQYRNLDGTTYFKCQDQIREHCEDVKNKPKILQRPYSCVTSEYGCTINGKTCENECKFRGHRDYRGFSIYKCNVPYDVHDSGLKECSSDSKHTIVEDESCIGLCNKGDKKDEFVPAGTYWCNIGGGDDKWNYCSPDKDTITSELSTTLPAITIPEPVDCKLTWWTDWSSCTVTCGDGTRTRLREILAQESNGGKPCETTEEQPCFMEKCPDPVDCSLTNWSSWSGCSVTCGGGRKSKTREVSVAASHGGEPCGKLEMDMHCNTQICPDCSCSDFINKKGFGQCKKGSSRVFGGSPLCYINLPSTCTDKKKSGTDKGKWISAEACKLKSEITTSQSQSSSEKTESTAKTTSSGSDQESVGITNVTVSPGFHPETTKEGSFTITYTMGIIIGVSVTTLIVSSAITWCWCTRDKKGPATNSTEEDPGVFIIKDKDGKVLSDEYIRSCCGILLDRESSSGQFLAQLKRYHGTEIIERVEENEEYGYAYGLQDYEPGEIVDYNVGYHAPGDSDSDGESVAEIIDANAMYGRASTSS